MDGSRCNVYMGSVYSLENKWTYFEVEKIILREDYVDTEFKNDIALLKLKTPVVYTPYIQPICLPHKRYSEKDYQDCYSVGIGKTIKGFIIFIKNFLSLLLKCLKIEDPRS